MSLTLSGVFAEMRIQLLRFGHTESGLPRRQAVVGNRGGLRSGDARQGAAAKSGTV